MKIGLFILLVIGAIACLPQEKSTIEVEHSFTLAGHDYVLPLPQDYQLVQNSTGITIDFAPGGIDPIDATNMHPDSPLCAFARPCMC